MLPLVKFVRNILRSTAKSINGLISNLITLEGRQLKNKQSKIVFETEAYFCFKIFEICLT